jgi:signal transduction histidine kinase
MINMKRLFRSFRALRISLSYKFMIGIGVVLAMTMGTSFHYISLKHEALIFEQMDMQARAFFTQIVLTRKWIADHGGIFVWAPNKNPSPYLANPTIIDIQGKKYIRQSPAMVTKELSKYARDEGTYSFHITSLKLTNPENSPDDFEKAALIDFESGKKIESSAVEKRGTSLFYRYIAPLYVQDSCLQCHSHQGYKTGDVRGAISIAVPMDRATELISSERKDMVLAGVATIGILMLVMYVMIKELVLSPVKQLHTGMNNFSGGGVTETSTIRTGDELEDLSGSFVDMSRTLTEYHSGLENRVREATKSLEGANLRLTELNSRKSDFIAKVSHELRTPLTSIKGAMDYLSARFSLGVASEKDMSEISGFFDVIRNNADRLIRMVNDTLDLERIESGMFELHLGEFKLISLVKDIITSFHVLVSDKGVTFKIIAKPEVSIIADEDMIRQVLTNLICNALEASPFGSEIHVLVSESEESVTVYIKDEGHGIPEEEKEKIFDKFYTRGTKEGTGLGLAICRGIIEAHRGEIGITGNGERKGSTFYFSLPRNWEDSKS